MDETTRHLAIRTAARVAAVVCLFIAVFGAALVWGTDGETGVAGIGGAVAVVLGGSLLVMACLTGLAAAVLWLVALREEGEARRKSRVIGPR